MSINHGHRGEPDSFPLETRNKTWFAYTQTHKYITSTGNHSRIFSWSSINLIEITYILQPKLIYNSRKGRDGESTFPPAHLRWSHSNSYILYDSGFKIISPCIHDYN